MEAIDTASNFEKYGPQSIPSPPLYGGHASMTDVFLSYATEDLERARKLASALEAQGWSVWWDRKIKAGQTFDQVIEHELDTAKSVVVLWSKESILSEWVKSEAAAAADRGVLVPAFIDKVKLPLQFRRRLTADLIRWDGDQSHAGFRALCDGIATTAHLPTPTVPSVPGPPRKASAWWSQLPILGSILALALVVTAGAYTAFFVLPPQVVQHSEGDPISESSDPQKKTEEPTASSSAANTVADEQPSAAAKAGIFEFKWPGDDGWTIYRGEKEVASGFGSGKQALQAGTYTVKPLSSAVFEPFTIQVTQGQTATAP